VDIRRNSMKIQDAIWFTEMGTPRPIGIIYGEDEVTGEKKAYIGTGHGFNEHADTQHIAKYGAKLTLETVKQLLGYLSP
jgi:hypothetical protein